MIAADEDALICDLAEVYHIYDYRALSPRMAATLAVGLRENSRIKMKISGAKATTEVLLLAAAIDRLSVLVWQNTKDGQKGRNRPDMLVDAVQGQKAENEVLAFQSGDAFMEAYKKLTGGD